MERDRIRQDSRPRRGARRRRSRTRRAVRRNRALALAILVILGLAALAPVGLASDSSRSAERAQQKALRDAERLAERETKRTARREAHKTEAQEKRAAREAAQRASEGSATIVTHHAVVTLECDRIVVQYQEFADSSLPNVVYERVSTKQGKPGPSWSSALERYSFSGTASEHVIPVTAPVGQSTVVFRGRFNSNGVRGTAAAHARLYCGPIPGFTLSTQQSLGGPYSAATKAGKVGETVFYETKATNSGNTPLTFSGFSAPGCDHAAAGGSTEQIPPHGTLVFNCSHALSPTDAAHGFFANAASVTGTPGPDEGEPITHVSSGVLVSPVEIAEPEVTVVAKPAGGAPGAGGSSGTNSAAPTKSGELSFSSARIPSLLGPARCVRGLFTVSVKSAGVASVVFYLDGHKLTRRTSHSAQKGLISLRINGAKLKPGIHHLRATIYMKPGSPTAKAVVAMRTRSVRRCSVVKTTH